MKKLVLIVVVSVVLVGVYAAMSLVQFATTGVGLANEEVVFEVPPGTTLAKVALRLHEKGLLADTFKFRIFAKLTSQENRLKRGEYLLNRAMTPQQLLDLLASGKSIQYPVTFPEGSNIYDMAQLIETKGFFKAQDFLVAVKDPVFIQALLGAPEPSLEGYLFPETYNVTRYTTLKELIKMMVSRFDENYKGVTANVVSSLSKHEIVTLASVVEKETGAAEERPIIASVFYNRLHKGMPLQSDPTIMYGILDETGKPVENITKADILRPNRYNTYTVKRLPYGPISNPGKEALAAVIKPAATDFLYFVSRNNGTHVFTKTYAEHLKGVQNFQLNPTAREGKSWRDLKKRTPSN
jgi:UPF0755 protein